MPSVYGNIFGIFLQSDTFRRLRDLENGDATRAVVRSVRNLIPFLNVPSTPNDAGTSTTVSTTSTNQELIPNTLPFYISVPVSSSISSIAGEGEEEVAVIHINADGDVVRIEREKFKAGSFKKAARNRAERGILKDIRTDTHGVEALVCFTPPEASNNAGPVPTVASTSGWWLARPVASTSTGTSTSSSSSSGPSSYTGDQPEFRPIERQNAFRYPDVPPPPGYLHAFGVPPRAPGPPRPVEREYAFYIPKPGRRRTYRPVAPSPAPAPAPALPPSSSAPTHLTTGPAVSPTQAMDVGSRTLVLSDSFFSRRRVAYSMGRMFEDSTYEDEDQELQIGNTDRARPVFRLGWGLKRTREEYENDDLDADEDSDKENIEGLAYQDADDDSDKENREELAHQVFNDDSDKENEEEVQLAYPPPEHTYPPPELHQELPRKRMRYTISQEEEGLDHFVRSPAPSPAVFFPYDILTPVSSRPLAAGPVPTLRDSSPSPSTASAPAGSSHVPLLRRSARQANAVARAAEESARAMASAGSSAGAADSEGEGTPTVRRRRRGRRGNAKGKAKAKASAKRKGKQQAEEDEEEK